MQCHILITFLCACIQILMSCLCKYTSYIMLGGLTSNGALSILCSAMVVPLMLVILLGAAAQGMSIVHLQKKCACKLNFLHLQKTLHSFRTFVPYLPTNGHLLMSWK